MGPGRLITSISAAEAFDNDGMEWIRLSVEGQSFMLHQIRKMVSCELSLRPARFRVVIAFDSRPSGRWLSDGARLMCFFGEQRKSETYLAVPHIARALEAIVVRR